MITQLQHGTRVATAPIPEVAARLSGVRAKKDLTPFTQPLRETMGRAPSLSACADKTNRVLLPLGLLNASLNLARCNPPDAAGSFLPQPVAFLPRSDVLAKVKSVRPVCHFPNSTMTSPSHHRSLRNDPKFYRNPHE